jgi:hypothetical protein
MTMQRMLIEWWGPVFMVRAHLAMTMQRVQWSLLWCVVMFMVSIVLLSLRLCPVSLSIKLLNVYAHLLLRASLALTLQRVQLSLLICLVMFMGILCICLVARSIKLVKVFVHLLLLLRMPILLCLPLTMQRMQWSLLSCLVKVLVSLVLLSLRICPVARSI